MKKTMTLLVAVCLIAAVGSIAYAGASGISDPTITVTQFTTPDKLRDKTHETVDSIDTAVKAVIDDLDSIAAGTSVGTIADATAARVCTSADYGQLISYSGAGAFAVTLPANGAPAGTYIDFVQGGVQNDTTAIVISSTPADTLITTNSVDSDSVAFGSGHRIGAYVRVISDGGFWMAINLGNTTMTVTDTD
jgi:hypothetical protein